MKRFHGTILACIGLFLCVLIHGISGDAVEKEKRVKASIHGLKREPLTEDVRVREHDKRYSREWPPAKFTPDTVGWNTLMSERLRQVAEIDSLDRRYEGYMQVVMTGMLLPNFTEYGFGLARGPEGLSAALREGIRGGLERGEARLEHSVEVIEGPRCLFIDRPDLTQRVRNSNQKSFFTA